MLYTTDVNKKEQRFGGPWTSEKLYILKQYLSAYTIALQYQPTPHNPFELLYIDAFAGRGHCYIKDEGNEVIELDGSAKIALELKKPFHTYYFIDNDTSKLADLDELCIKCGSRDSSFILKNGDANTLIIELCKSIDWSGKRAVMFLDPFGLQVSWNTIETIAKTRAIDLWMLVPIFGINRMLKNDGRISDSWKAKLNDVLGGEDWYSKFYQKSPQTYMWDKNDHFNKIANFDTIIKYIVSKLQGVFAGVHPNPRIFTNDTNSPLFAFCFALGNPSPAAKKLALRLAGHILR